MERLFRNPLHQKEGSHDCVVKKTKDGRKVKFTYRAFNAGEKLTVELFDGNKWNQMLDMQDIGFIVDKNAYHILTPNNRKNRANMLFRKAEELILLILS